MGRKFAKDKEKEKKIAKDHIDRLFSEAESTYKEDMSLSNKYVKMARDIQMKFRMRMPSEYKRKFCKHCHSYLVPTVSCRIRIHDSKLIYSCYSCKKFTRIPLKK